MDRDRVSLQPSGVNAAGSAVQQGQTATAHNVVPSFQRRLEGEVLRPKCPAADQLGLGRLADGNRTRRQWASGSCQQKTLTSQLYSRPNISPALPSGLPTIAGQNLSSGPLFSNSKTLIIRTALFRFIKVTQVFGPLHGVTSGTLSILISTCLSSNIPCPTKWLIFGSLRPKLEHQSHLIHVQQ